MNQKNFCPICRKDKLNNFLIHKDVPTQQNSPTNDQQSAINVTRGNLSLVVCHECGFIFNRTFDLSRLRYGENYENTQNYSPSFAKYVSDHIKYLVNEKNIQNCTIVEIGCGNGTFLRKLVENDQWGNIGYGFDPSYIGPDSEFDNRLKFERRNYDKDCINILADVVICRHVIEHVPEPIVFLNAVRQSLPQSHKARVFFETPDVKWILQNHVIWDFFYEHCSYFTEYSLTTAFEATGFKVESVKHVFGGQYLWLEATVLDKKSVITKNVNSIPTLANQFAEIENQLKKKWENKLAELSKKGKIALWGAGAKGVTFANLMDPKHILIDCIIDLNPKKQGKYIPGTGHPIVSYTEVISRQIKTAILMNPNYYDESLRLLKEANLKIDLIT